MRASFALLAGRCVPQQARRGMSETHLSATIGAATRSCNLPSANTEAFYDLKEKVTEAICGVK